MIDRVIQIYYFFTDVDFSCSVTHERGIEFSGCNYGFVYFFPYSSISISFMYLETLLLGHKNLRFLGPIEVLTYVSLWNDLVYLRNILRFEIWFVFYKYSWFSFLLISVCKKSLFLLFYFKVICFFIFKGGFL